MTHNEITSLVWELKKVRESKRQIDSLEKQYKDQLLEALGLVSPVSGQIVSLIAFGGKQVKVVDRKEYVCPASTYFKIDV